MPNDNAAAEQVTDDTPPRALPTGITGLHLDLVSVIEAVHELGRRLDPILRPAHTEPSPDTAAAVHAVPDAAPLVLDVQAASERAAYLRAFIVDLNERVEV